jgi:hypothetical protein
VDTGGGTGALTGRVHKDFDSHRHSQKCAGSDVLGRFDVYSSRNATAGNSCRIIDRNLSSMASVTAFDYLGGFSNIHSRNELSGYPASLIRAGQKMKTPHAAGLSKLVRSAEISWQCAPFSMSGMSLPPWGLSTPRSVKRMRVPC